MCDAWFIIKVQCKGLSNENKGEWYLGSFWSFGGAIYLGYGLKSGGRLGMCYWFLFLDHVCLYTNNYAPKCTCGAIHVGSWLVICEGRI
jgi:hypothetical protein